MKIRKITIKKFHQFKDLNIDLTYPKGHKRAGQPLEKVCIIGQSGTGKTTLLNLIDYFSYRPWKAKNKYNLSDLYSNVIVERELSDLVSEVTIGEGSGDSSTTIFWNKWYLKSTSKNLSFDDATKFHESSEEAIKTQLIYYPVDLDYNIPDTDISDDTFGDHSVYDFSIEKAAEIWHIILAEIKKYQEKELKIRQDISKVAETSKDIDTIQLAVKKLENWRKRFKNPVKDLATKCLDPILRKFSLQVKTDLDISKKEDIGFIKIVNGSGVEIPHALWSTGTKQLILSLLPLYLLKPDNTIILFDEPERSLYPDMQRNLVDYYLQQITNSQFIIATHSPLIAASFEPWEIIELKFKNDGSVYRELYYKGENHVDNYQIHPKYLTYELILKEVFDLVETSSREREELLVEYLILREKLDKSKSDKSLNSKESKLLFEKFTKLGELLGWPKNL